MGSGPGLQAQHFFSLFVAPAQVLEKALEDLRAVLAEDIAGDPDLVVEIGILQDIQESAAAARFGAVSADHDSVDAGLDDGAGAHLAGLQGAVQCAALETPVPGLFTGLFNAGDLGVGERGLVRIAPVVTARNDPAVIYDDRPDRDFAEGDGFFRLLQGGFHIFGIFRILPVCFVNVF